MTAGCSLVVLGPSQLMIDYAERYVDRLLVIDTADNVARFDCDPAVTRVVDLDYVDAPLADLCDRVREFRDDGHASERFCGVLALTDRALLMQARIDAMLGVDDNAPECIEMMVDKLSMREALSGHPAWTVGYGIASDAAQARSVVQGFASAYPCIAKPRIGRGSLGVSVVRSPQGFDGLRFPLLVEEMAQGQEYSVEGICDRGRYRMFGMTMKEKGRPGDADELAEFGHLHPACVEPEVSAAVEAMVSGLMRTLGVTTGIHHTEVFVTSDGQVKVVETHARNGGQHIVDIVRIATGVDMVDCAIRQRVGILREGDMHPRRHGYAGVRYLHCTSGRVVRMRGAARTRFTPGVCAIEFGVGVGEVFHAGTGSGEQIGCVVAQSDSYDGLRGVLAEACDAIDITVC